MCVKTHRQATHNTRVCLPLSTIDNFSDFVVEIDRLLSLRVCLWRVPCRRQNDSQSRYLSRSTDNIIIIIIIGLVGLVDHRQSFLCDTDTNMIHSCNFNIYSLSFPSVVGPGCLFLFLFSHTSHFLFTATAIRLNIPFFPRLLFLLFFYFPWPILFSFCSVFSACESTVCNLILAMVVVVARLVAAQVFVDVVHDLLQRTKLRVSSFILLSMPVLHS